MTIVFTDTQVKQAAKIVKIIKLAGHPGMDAVSIKLNCGPTYEEIEIAGVWAKAFEHAVADMSAFEAAELIVRGRRR